MNNIWTIVYKSVSGEIKADVVDNDNNMISKRNDLVLEGNELIDIFLSEYYK